MYFESVSRFESLSGPGLRLPRRYVRSCTHCAVTTPDDFLYIHIIIVVPIKKISTLSSSTTTTEHPVRFLLLI